MTDRRVVSGAGGMAGSIAALLILVGTAAALMAGVLSGAGDRAVVGVVLLAWAILAAWMPEASVAGLLAVGLLGGHVVVRGAAGSTEMPVVAWLALATLAGCAGRRLAAGCRAPRREGDVPANDDAHAAPPRWMVVLLGAMSVHVVGRGLVAILRVSEGWPLRGGPLEIVPINTLGELNVPAMIRIGIATCVGGAMPWLVVVGWRAVRDAAALGRLVATMGGAFAIAAVVGAWQTVRGAAGSELSGALLHFAALGQVPATFIDPNAVGTCAMLATPFLLAAALGADGVAWRRVVAAVGLGAIVVLLVVSGSRTGAAGSFLGACGVLGWWWVRRRRGGDGDGEDTARSRDAAACPQETTRPARWRAVLPAVVVGAVGVAIVVGVLWAAMGSGGRVGLIARADQSVRLVEEGGLGAIWRADRVYNWRRALRVIRAEPWAGTGPGAYETELPNVFGWVKGWEEYRDNALNHYLHVAAEVGVPGLVLFLGVLGGLVVVACGAVRGGVGARSASGGWGAGGGWTRALVAQLGVVALALVTGAHLVHAEVAALWYLMAGATLGASAGDGGATERREGDDGRVPSEPGDARRRRLMDAAAGIFFVGVAVAGIGASALRAQGDGSLRATLARSGMWVRGVHDGAPGAGGGTYDYWLAPVAELCLERGVATTIDAVVAHPDPAAYPVTVVIAIDGEPAPITLRWDAPYLEQRIVLRAPEVAERGRFALTRITTSSGWVPAESDPASDDTRLLGVLFRAHLAAPGAPDGE